MKAGVYHALIVCTIVTATCVYQRFSFVPAHAIGLDYRMSSTAVVDDDKSYVPHGTIEEVAFYAPKTIESREWNDIRKGVLVTHEGAKATVVICHGFMCNKTDFGFLRHLFSPRYNTLIFDFRAHGESANDGCCSFGRDEAGDVLGAVRYVKRHPELKGKPVIGYGMSMGSVAALGAQAQCSDAFDALILDSPFTSSDDLIRHGLGNMRVRVLGYEIPIPGRTFLESQRYNPRVQSLLKYALKTVAKMETKEVTTCIKPVVPKEWIAHISVPLYIVGCMEDKKFPPGSFEQMFDAAKGYKRLWLTKGRTHCDSYFYNPEKYTHKINRFVEKVLDGTIANIVQVDDQSKLVKTTIDR